MTLPLSEVLLSRVISEYSLIVNQVTDANIEDEFDRGWVSALIVTSTRLHSLLSELRVEVSPPPQMMGTRYHPVVRQMVQ